MSQKTSKKLRQLYRRELREAAQKQAERQAEQVQKQMDEFTANLDNILKPAPRFIPEFIWVSLQRIFLNI